MAHGNPFDDLAMRELVLALGVVFAVSGAALVTIGTLGALSMFRRVLRRS